jgi:hypothetical protein
MKNTLKLIAAAVVMFAFSTNVGATTLSSMAIAKTSICDQDGNGKKCCKKDAEKKECNKDAAKKECSKDGQKKSCDRKDGAKKECKKSNEKSCDKK